MSTIEKLRIDENYYGEFGNQFMSNSAVQLLLSDPYKYSQGIPNEVTKPMLEGRYFHQRILEPEREIPLRISQENSRNSKAYKDEAGDEMILLQKEVDAIEPIIERVRGNEFFMERLRGNLQENEIEEPAIGMIFGEMFKGKADRINKHDGMIYDLKKTSDLSKFKSSIFRYGYDTQAAIYEELFGYEFAILAVDSFTGSLGYFTFSEETKAQAREKIARAIEIKNNANLSNHVTIEII